jgi:hypothetical protein
MIFGIPFATFRLIIITLAVLSQIYLFVRIRQSISSSPGSDRFKSRAVLLIGAAICLLFALNGYILFRPVTWIDPPAAAQALLLYPPAVWCFGALFSAFMLLLSRIICRLILVVRRLYRTLAGKTSGVPVDLSRRQFLKAGVFGIAAAPFIASGYGAAYVVRSCEVNKFVLPFGCPVRAVQLTDIHAGIYMTRKQMRRYVDQVAALKPDIFLLTGDYISNSLSFLPECLEEMARVSTRYGTFATLGNHEHWYGRMYKIREMFRQHRIVLLNNAHKVIQTERGHFALIGIDDLRFGHPDLEAALSGLDTSIPAILLSHRPEIFPRAAALGIPLTLSGHYHGGQIKLSLPGVDLSLAHFSTPYPEGLYRVNISHLYVSRGVGTTFIPVRLNAPPELTLFDLT